MKRATPLIAAVPLALGLVAVAAGQRRATPEEVPSFEACLETAEKRWNQESYGACTAALRQAIAHAMAKRREVILAALPAAPEGWTVVPQQDAEEAANPFAAQMMAAVGNMIEQEYRQTEGRGSVRIAVTADSPMLQMFSMMLQNPAMLPKGAELIEYDQTKAILETQSGGNQLTLKMVLNEDTLVETTARGLTDDALLGLMSQAAVDKLVAALSR